MASKVVFPKEEPYRPPGWVPEETAKEKFFRKMKEQPLVPLGSLATCGALIVASHYLRKGDRKAFNRALRWRIYFQGLTAIAAVGGVYYYGLAKEAQAPEDATSTTPYSNVATIPGRPPTNLQVNKQGDREAQSRKEWEERLREAQRRETEAEDQRKLEAALLKGTGFSADETEGTKKRDRPTIGKDRRTRAEE